MRIRRIRHLPRSAPLLAGVLLLCAGPLLATVVQATQPVTFCLAPTSATLIGMQTGEAGPAVDGLLASYLAGPALRLVSLESRVPSLARSEAAAAACTYLLFTRVKHERRSSGLVDRIAAGAIHSGAGNAAARADSVGARVLASAAAGAAGTVAASGHVRTRDEIALSYRLETGDGRTLATHTTKRRATTDGEDLLGPMIESLAEATADRVVGGPVPGSARLPGGR
jgi:hypothetical protein